MKSIKKHFFLIGWLIWVPQEQVVECFLVEQKSGLRFCPECLLCFFAPTSLENDTVVFFANSQIFANCSKNFIEEPK